MPMVKINEELSTYIVDISMGSQFKGTSIDLDEMNRKITYKYSKDKRNQIGACRQSINVAQKSCCMKFYKTTFTSASGKAYLEAECQRVDREMKAIDSTLHVTAIFYEQKVSALSSGNQFEAMREQLSIQVHKRVLDRVEKVIIANKNEDGTYKQMTGKTKTALINMLEKVKEINVLQDADVDARIEQMKQQINDNSLIPMRDEILALIEDVQQSESLEVVSPIDESTPGNVEYTPKTKATTAEDEALIHMEDLI